MKMGREGAGGRGAWGAPAARTGAAPAERRDGTGAPGPEPRAGGTPGPEPRADGAVPLVAPDLLGLTDEEAATRAREGRANVDAGPATKSYGQIVAEHAFTLFNGVNLALACLVAFTGSWRNLTFMCVVLLNLTIGIVQEARSKRTVDRLSILAERPVTVRRRGRDVLVGHAEVVEGDLVVLARGDQVPADARVVWGVAGVNESLLTGESEPVAKERGAELLSGSFLDSGCLVAEVTRVGASSFAARINAEAKYVKSAQSEIMVTLSMIIRLATWVLAPIGAALFFRTIQDGSETNQAILTTVAALVGMIPQGLVLLTSTVLAISTARLARRSVLIQQFYCIETLARVDVLCLDKTGTITSGSMDFSRAVGVDGADAGAVERAAATIAASSEADANETARAIIAHARRSGVAAQAVRRSVPFSSARKYSGCVTEDGSCLVMGAAQFVFEQVPDVLAHLLAGFGERERVLVVATCDDFDEHGAIVGEPRALGAVALSDHIRDSAARTVAYFVEQGVALKVISGDDPRTVSAVAEAAGVPDATRWVDASRLTTPEAVERAASEHVVFGRVTPQQKRELVQALQREGHTVAMTGDGVNDVLALREADCSVAMASGSDAARNVAEVVLVDNDFSHMPDVVAEGRRSINNLQRSASLFLVKTAFSAVLALVCSLFPPYPFQPVQMSLVSTAIIGTPSFVLALESNRERVRGNFLVNVLARSAPASVAIVLAVGAAMAAAGALGLAQAEASTMCVLLTALVGACLVLRISQPLNALRAALLAVVVGIVAVGCTVFADFFEIAPVTPIMGGCVLAIGAAALVLFNILFNYGVSLAEGGRGAFARVLSAVERDLGKRGDHGPVTRI